MVWTTIVKNVAARNRPVLSRCDWCKKYNITLSVMSDSMDIINERMDIFFLSIYSIYFLNILFFIMEIYFIKIL